MSEILVRAEHDAVTPLLVREVRALPDTWIWAAVAETVSPYTIRGYTKDLLAFEVWLLQQGLNGMLVERDDVLRWRAELHASGLKPATVNRRLAAVRKMYSEAVLRGWVQEDPTVRVKGLRVGHEHQGRCLTAAEARALLAACEGLRLRDRRDKALVLVLLECGLRRSEACGLRVEDMARTHGRAIVRVRLKGGRESVSVLTAEAEVAVSTWLQEAGISAGPMFRGIRSKEAPSSKAMSPGEIAYIVRRRAEKAGISDDKDIIGPHDLRHTAITVLHRQGVPLDRIRDFAHHESGTTTLGYVVVADRYEDPVADALSRWLRA